MALTVGGDGWGLYAVLDCAAEGCGCHVSLRPTAADQTAYDLACATFDIALDEGWWLDGSAWCSEHWPADRLGRPVAVADGYAWVSVTREPVNGPQGRSEPLIGGSSAPH